jgi:nucleotide-binding universal stress UspA family protein
LQWKNGMPIKDIFFPMISYPVPTLPLAVEKAIGLAVGLRAQISGSTFEINIRAPVGIYSDLPEISEKLDVEAKKSAVNARDLVALFTDVAARQNAISEHSVEQCMPAELPSLLADHARLRDLTIFPLREADQHTRGIVEAVIFESGRPILLLPEMTERELPLVINHIAVAWDNSRAAARAIADALPFLQAAKHVYIFTVIDEGRFERRQSSTELRNHLARHGIDATFATVRSSGHAIGSVLETYVVEHNIELLVMGAYGHARIREFFLGGATKSVLVRPIIWTLLSH